MTKAQPMPREASGRFTVVHGGSYAPEYAIWANLVYRCHTETSPQFKDYGGRGIQVCARWRDSFAAFLEDMGPRADGKSVERKNVNGNYEPGNCCWATATEQANNRRNTVRIDGMTLRHMADATGLTMNAIKSRARRGWTAERILSQPARNYPRGAHAHC
jgi:hypothetical protein